ncbi:MAG: hypothetical protein LBD12_00925 [Clostridiales Family XIII bacterium]|nr:hypothetical protein [Clostridiales Family XIII bacterium]
MEDLERFAGASVLEIGGRIMSLLAMGYIHSVKHPGLVDDIALDDLYMVTETGRDFVESRRRDDLRWWFTTAISVGALAVGITALMRTF